MEWIVNVGAGKPSLDDKSLIGNWNHNHLQRNEQNITVLTATKWRVYRICTEPDMVAHTAKLDEKFIRK